MLKSNYQRLNNPENKDQIQDQFKKMSRAKKSIESIQLEINVKQISHQLTHTHTQSRQSTQGAIMLRFKKNKSGFKKIINLTYSNS